jgi:hypothetical protein
MLVSVVTMNSFTILIDYLIICIMGINLFFRSLLPVTSGWSDHRKLMIL